MGCGASSSQAMSSHESHHNKSNNNNLPDAASSNGELADLKDLGNPRGPLPEDNNNAAEDDANNLESRILTRKFTLNSIDLVKDLGSNNADQNFVEIKVDSTTKVGHNNDLLQGVMDVDSEPRKTTSVYCTEVGFAPFSRKVNQDSLLIATELNDEVGVDLYGVFDGHGEFGHLVSRFVAEKLPVFVEAELLNNSSPAVVLNRAVFKLCEALKKSNIRTSYSGTTATFALRCNSMLHIGNLGDSRAVLAKRELQPDGTFKFVAYDLSIDHKPDLPAEKQRILASGGRVETLRGPPGTDCGPYRVWLAKVDVPGLAMSRSVGDDVAHSVGVSSEVEVQSHLIQDEDAFMIIATDGVWEFISSQDAVDIVGKYSRDMNKAVRKLVKKAQGEWRKYEQVIDDTTAVVVSFMDSDALGFGRDAESDSSVENVRN